MTRLRPLVTGVVLAASAAWAQSSGAPVKDREAVTFHEIERGFNFSVGGGPFFLLQAPNHGPFSAGQTARVEMGLDLGERLTISLFLLGSNNGADASYRGNATNANPASGDFAALVPGANARVNLLGFADGQDVRRTWLYVKGGAGYVAFQPSSLLRNSDILVFGSAGVDYFTHLRHFSIGLEVMVSYLLQSSSLGFAVLPNLRYAF